MPKLHTFVGRNKDVSGKCRAMLTAVARKSGWDIAENIEDADAIAALGGDGTIMRAANKAVELDIPVIGVNLGRVGYMAELDESEISLVENFFNNRHYEENRMMLEIRVNDKSLYALNDAVLHAKNKHMSQYTLCCNGSVVNEYRGDGIIIATPTGSTAYSMSAGGSVIDPRLECICVTPICPQSLLARPLVFAPDSALSVSAQSEECMLTVDGGEPMRLEKGSVIEVCRSEKMLRMVKLKKDGFYEVLRKKSLT